MRVKEGVREVMDRLATELKRRGRRVRETEEAGAEEEISGSGNGKNLRKRESGQELE